jgi:hypothetical protein
MARKSLVMYSSHTGNTEKVARRFKKVFEEKGWECDLFKITTRTTAKDLPDLNGYDFLCLGSPVEFKLPTEELMALLNPKHGPRRPWAQKTPPPPPQREAGAREGAGKILFGADSKKGVAFATYSGHHLGPKEPDPALSFLESMVEHRKFQCVGRFACPGKMFNSVKEIDKVGWYPDIYWRPNKRDLQKAEIFIEEILEDYYS